MTLLYSDDRYLEHDTGPHPERSDRLRAIVEHLHTSGLWDRCQVQELRPATIDQVAMIHERDYVAQVQEFCEAGGGHIDVDTVLCSASYEVALLAAGAGVAAVDQVVGNGADRTALCLVRPPGHHATPRYAMGFCVFNNIAVAARHAVANHGLQRVLIVDWDVHHGNGTQEAFYADPQVAFLSIHRFPFYPGTGEPSEKGEGEAVGLTCNLPVGYGTPRDVYLNLFRTHFDELVQRFRPQLMLVSGGYDAHHADPIGSLGLQTEDFGTLSDIVLDAADEHADGRLISFLEGGYDLDALADCVGLHTECLLARD
jgi:acetoin utilization deacetylase AcuC-like enzyme